MIPIFQISDPDCEDVWEGGVYEDYISDSLLHQNGDMGWKSFDVTSDVQLVQNGEDHFGWLLRKRDSTASGSVDYTSIQGSSSHKPRLVVVTDDSVSACSPTFIYNLTPSVIASNGTSQLITVTGEGLDRVTQVKVDNSPVAFTVVNSTTLTISLSYTSVGTHEIWFRSNCRTQPLSNYTFLAETPLYGAEAVLSCTEYDDSVTWFSMGGSRLCWKGAGTLLIGYSGDFNYLTLDTNWNNGTDNTIVQNYMKRAQYYAGSGGDSSFGNNFIRIVTTGGSCSGSTQVGPDHCKDSAGNAEIMPFKRLTADKWDMLWTGSSVNNLRGIWKNRLKWFLKYADKNGIAVMISLFDENDMGADKWPLNPFNPANNNSGCTVSTMSGDALPGFYQIWNTDGSLNCLGKLEKRYVRSVIKWIKHNNLKVCGSAGNVRCRNTIFEVMNEARFDWDESWGSFDKNTFNDWHKAVAGWINMEGDYMVAADVKGTKLGEPCETDSLSDYCLLQACSSSSCGAAGSVVASKNYFQVFTGGAATNIDIVALHWGTWGTDTGSHDPGDICGRDDTALIFAKPVIFDDDGGKAAQADPDPDLYGRNDNNNVETWAQNVSGLTACACSGRTRGNLHYYHTGDGAVLEAAPSACQFRDTGKVDCRAWNGMADASPDKYCGTYCETRAAYCDSAGCTQNRCQ